ncbi:four-carbon acid sugar kinase family protein [Brachyspira pilosicoli]|uniref:four-carbon acid sugar kinase family protein n=1 Tax=Brachyspira pilosicoli TaxID=52584 RepID=UPI003007D1C1
MHEKIIIIADDFTGANDTGVKFAKAGYNTSVTSSHCEYDYNSDIMVINTETRLIDKNEAKEKINLFLNNLKVDSNKIIYKKIDSTFRGNIGAEIEALLNKFDYNVCVVANAFPSMNRTIVNGISYVNDIELDKTDFAKDPINPIKTSYIENILKEQTDYSIKLVKVDDIHNGKFQKDINNDINADKKIIYICDSEKDDDLLSISNILKEHLNKILTVGCAGFADALLNTINNFTPICFVSGSLSKISMKQLKIINGKNAQLINIDKNLFFSSDFEKLQNDLKRQIDKLINLKKHIIISITVEDEDREINKFYAQKNFIENEDIAKYIASTTAKIIKFIFEYIKIKALFISGGNTAIHIMKEFGANNVHLFGEIDVGIPYGIITDGLYPFTQIATKAGAFGDDNLYLKVIEFYNNR